MATENPIKPVETPLPPPPSFDFFNEYQWETLFALMDGAIPSITSESLLKASTDKNVKEQISLPDDQFEKLVASGLAALGSVKDRKEIESFLANRPIDNPLFRDDCKRTLALSPQKAELGRLLSILGTRPGSLLLTQCWNPVTKQPPHVREAILKSWSTSRLGDLRMLVKNIATIAQKAYCISSPLFKDFSGYDDVPLNWKRVDGYDYNFLQAPTGGKDEVHEIETEVVIVGSGCGGGVAAKNLAEAGHKVLVVDKGYYFPPSHLPMPQDAAASYLFDHGGVYLSESTSTGITCGGSWGGGGTVNWSVSLRTQDYVRKEWNDEGLEMFGTKAYDECMDRVSEFAGVGTSAIRHNMRNNMILDGSEKLGWKAQPCPQNTGGKEHYCGQCHLGCGSAEKRGPAVSWLPAAGEAGAEFMEGFQVEKVLFGPDGETAIGVEGLWTSRDKDGNVHTPLEGKYQRKVVIKAKKVVISSGSLWSPLILMRSGIKVR